MNNAADTFITNMELLLSHKKLSNRQLGVKAGVSDRLIGMYRNRESAPTIEKAEKIAKALGFELWQLQIPGFQPDIIEGDRFNQLYQAYIATDEEGRRVMESTATYITSHKQLPANENNDSDSV